MKEIHKSNNLEITNLKEAGFSYENLEKILKGIPDIIGVYTVDHSILFYNQAGYDFYHRNAEAVKGKKCFQMLQRNEKCQDCPVDRAINLKQIIRTEEFIPEIQKYIEFFCNPIMDDSGEVLFVIEQLRDISEQNHMELLLKESSYNYRKIVNLSPDPMVILVNGMVVLANKQVLNTYGDVIGEQADKFVSPEYLYEIRREMKKIFINKTTKNKLECRLTQSDGKIIDTEIVAGYFDYKGKPAIIILIRDISERVRELNEAAAYQRVIMNQPFPFNDIFELNTLYIPVKKVSGDFYFFHKTDDCKMVGILGDISGKGVTAALSISAFRVLFHEAVVISSRPMEVIQILNHKVSFYMGDKYIAACCFSIDFQKKEVVVVGAGINQFLYKKNSSEYDLKIIKGPFLGMFNTNDFEEESIRYQPEDCFLFFTDGLDPIVENRMESINQADSLHKLTDMVYSYINEFPFDLEKTMDDCTLLALKMK
jgi:phosphoserine phosphatase RsbU/P